MLALQFRDARKPARDERARKMNRTDASPTRDTVYILGIPFDANSSYLRGAAHAPPLIRKALFSGSSNLWTEDGLDLGAANRLFDAGDLALPDDRDAAFAQIETAVRGTLASGHPLICLGGDHSITYPIVGGFSERFPQLSILHFDAHPDLYDQLDGNRFSHACPFARILEAGHVQRLVQIGIRTLNRHQHEQAAQFGAQFGARFGVEMITMRNLGGLASLKFEGPLYISLDLDVLDPAFAPGVSHYEPGGMSVRDVVTVLQNLPATVVGADIVEFNPVRDHHDQTAMVCAKLLKEIAAAMLRGGNAPAAGWP